MANQTYMDYMVQGFEDELRKYAAKKKAAGIGKGLGLMAAGGGLTIAGVRAEKDRRLGRRLRVQQRR